MTVGGAGQGNLATLPAEDGRRRRPSTGRPFRIFGPSLDLASGFTLPPRDGESPWMRFNEVAEETGLDDQVRLLVGLYWRPRETGLFSSSSARGRGARERPPKLGKPGAWPTSQSRCCSSPARRTSDPGLRTAEAGDRPGRLRRRRPEDIRRRRGTKRPPLSRFPVPQLGARDVGGGRGRRGAISEFLIGSAG
jgi:hypothetical protein